MLPAMTVLGFDPSLTSSGFCYGQEDDIVTGRILTKELRGIERLLFIRDQFIKLIGKVQPSILAYEGYSMGLKGGKVFDLGELGGVLKTVAFEKNIDILVVPPTSLKLFATGKGNAKKPDISKAVADVWGYKVTQNDEADAFVLFQMGRAFKSARISRAYEDYARKALNGCELVSANYIR
jgi:crossover junction endodeoxyribonuclease RuvC